MAIKITGSNEIIMILENKIIQPENSLIIKNGLSYICCQDFSKLIDTEKAPALLEQAISLRKILYTFQSEV